MSRPLIQIDDEVREMTESEFLQWQKDTASKNPEVTKEQLLAEVQLLMAKIEALQ